MPTYQGKDITSEFEDLDRGTLLYSPLFDGEDPFNCSLFRVIPGRSITVVHNGIRYTFDEKGKFGDMQGRQIFLKKCRCRHK